MGEAQIVYFGEKQKPDVHIDASGEILDVTDFTEEVVQATPGEPTRIICVWNYCYYDIPITRISKKPEFQRRATDVDMPEYPSTSVVKVVEPVTGKWIGIEFTVNPMRAIDSWVCNLQVECEYFNEELGRKYKHRRMGTFTFSTQPTMKSVLEQLT